MINHEQIDVLRQRTQLKRDKIKAKKAELARREVAKKRLLAGMGEDDAHEEQRDSSAFADKARE